MVSAPYNPHVELARTATKIKVLLGPEDGTAPGPEDEVEYLRLLSVTRTAGGQNLDYAEFAYDLGAVGERLQDIEVPEGWSRQVEVRIPGEDGDPDTLLFWGELSEQEIKIDASGESAIVRARIEPYHFGSVLLGPMVDEHFADDEYQLREDITFNPEIDGQIKPNRSDKRRENGESFLWIDPEAATTANAQDELSATPTTWDLAHALESLQFMANTAETYFRNHVTVEPDSGDAIPPLDEAPAIYNVKLRRGGYLPQYLDALLQPHGYDWCVVHWDDDGTRDSEIRIFKAGSGVEKQVYLQAPGEDLEIDKSNAAQFAQIINVADIANRVVCEGGLQQREVTIELERGWDASDDSLTADELERDGENWPAKANVWRNWVGNETGDFLGFALDLSEVFDDFTPRKRRLEPILQAVPGKNTRREVVVEYSVDDGDTWMKAPTDEHAWSFKVRTDEMGIYFTGKTPPHDLISGGSEAKVRVTAVVTGDARVTGTAERQSTSPSARDITMFVDVSDRFADIRPATSGESSDYYSRLEHGDTTFVRDDSTAIQEYAEKLRDANDSAVMRVDLTIHGITTEYEIGDLLTKVEGREISFNRNAPNVDTKRYMQITGITWDIPTQSTRLNVQPVEVLV